MAIFLDSYQQLRTIRNVDFVLNSTLVRPCAAYYVISVRRFGNLPA